MPSVIQFAQNLQNGYLNGAPNANRENIKRVIQIYKENKNVTNNIAEKVVMSLYLPSAFGHVGQKRKPIKADEMYDDFVKNNQKPIHQRRHREAENTQKGNQEEVPAEGRALSRKQGSNTPMRNRSNTTRWWIDSSRRDRVSTT